VNDQNDTRRARLGLRSPTGLFLLGAGLFVLLGLVAAVSRAHHVPGGHAGSHAPPAGVGNYLVSIVLVVMAVTLVTLLYVGFTEREALARTKKARRGRGMYKALAILLGLGLVAAVISRSDVLQRLHRGGNGAAKATPGALARLKHKPLPPGIQGPAQFEWLPVFIAGGGALLVLGYVGLRTVRRSRHALLEGHLLEQQFEIGRAHV